MTPPMMQCGHAANATDGTGAPCCAICDGPKARTVAPSAPDLTGRVARCSYYGRGHIRPMGMRGGAECDACRARIRDAHESGRSVSCACSQPSSPALAFFAYRGPGTAHHAGESPFGEYYCGCFGWD